MQLDINQQIANRVPQVLEGLGFDSTQICNGKNQPCPATGEGTDRFRFQAKPDGAGLYYCHCTNNKYGDIFQFLKCARGWDFKESCAEIRKVLGVDLPKSKPAPRKDPGPWLKKTWRQARQGDGRIQQYLNNRGLGHIPTPWLRYHPGMKGDDGTVYPVMLARVFDQEGPNTVHRTYLTQQGHKAPLRKAKKLMPSLRPMTGCNYIPLVNDGACTHMHIAEGIETALSAIELFSATHVAATVSAVWLERFEPPPECEELSILADNDKSYAGQAAAFCLARRLSARLRVNVLVPQKQGTDWLDYLNSTRRAAS